MLADRDMRVIVRKERLYPGAQLRPTDIDGHRFTAFATDTPRGQLANLELRHRRRARCEDRTQRQRNRAAQPDHCTDSAKPALVRAAGHGQRTTGLDVDALFGGPRPRLGNQAAAAVRRGRAWRAAAAACGCAWLPPSPGHPNSPPPSPACMPSPPADQPHRPLRPEDGSQGPLNPAHPARQPGTRHSQT